MKVPGKLGYWSFIAGLVLAIIIALIAGASPPDWAIFVLGFVGLVVGLLNITDKEVNAFLIATIAFIVSAGALAEVFKVILVGWGVVGAFFNLLTVFFAPAAAIVALKALYAIAKE